MRKFKHNFDICISIIKRSPQQYIDEFNTEKELKKMSESEWIGKSYRNFWWYARIQLKRNWSMYSEAKT